MKRPLRFDEGCGPLLMLTVRRGPSAGTTLVDCPCGWRRTYKTRTGAKRCGNQHIALGNGDAA